jgi:hypothetical protein
MYLAVHCYVEQLHLRGGECADKNGIRALKNSFGFKSNGVNGREEWDKVTA